MLEKHLFLEFLYRREQFLDRRVKFSSVFRNTYFSYIPFKWSKFNLLHLSNRQNERI